VLFAGFSTDIYHMDGLVPGWVAANVQSFYETLIYPNLTAQQQASGQDVLRVRAQPCYGSCHHGTAFTVHPTVRFVDPSNLAFLRVPNSGHARPRLIR
jgi:hypothetical protein